MTYTLDDLLQSLSTRKSADRWGVGLASQYLADMQSCLTGDGVCPTKLFDLADGAQWKKELDEAGRRLTWADSGATVIKTYSDGVDTPSGAVLTYDTVLTSKRKDRDGDILEPMGLAVDKHMPLLWQHIQVQPIGKFVTELGRSEDQVVVKNAIADTELGRDAATLTKFGALRTSHGFKPSVFEPVAVEKDSSGAQRVQGWHIKEADCMEVSLVSIPSNVDAGVLAVYEKEFDGVCTAHSRGMLKSQAVNLWAKGIYEQRPTVGKGWTPEESKKQIADVASKLASRAMCKLAAGDVIECMAPIEQALRLARKQRDEDEWNAAVGDLMS